MNYGVLPEGKSELFNLGKQLIHEIGHWFGLYHPFSGSCNFDGDYIDDTPMQTEVYGKPNVIKACDSTKFVQIHNYMQYVDDEWLTEFTPQQLLRMKAVILLYKTNFIKELKLDNINFSVIEN